MQYMLQKYNYIIKVTNKEKFKLAEKNKKQKPKH